MQTLFEEYPIGNLDALLKGRGLPDGTKRTHGGRPVIKRNRKIDKKEPKVELVSENRVLDFGMLTHIQNLPDSFKSATIENLAKNMTVENLRRGLKEIEIQRKKYHNEFSSATTTKKFSLEKDMQALSTYEDFINTAIAIKESLLQMSKKDWDQFSSLKKQKFRSQGEAETALHNFQRDTGYAGGFVSHSYETGWKVGPNDPIKKAIEPWVMDLQKALQR